MDQTIIRRSTGPPLSRFVECIWYSARRVSSHPRERALATGAVTLIIRLEGEPLRIFDSDADVQGRCFRESLVWGPRGSHVVTDTARRGAVVGVQFKPGGAGPVLGLPASELTGVHVSLSDVWGAAARRLRENLLDAPTTEILFQRLEIELLARISRRRFPHPAATHALSVLAATPETALIGRIQKDTGYSPKRFIALFSSAVGLTPKLYSRIGRFQSVIRAVSQGAKADWAQVALDCGYSDQSHLNREFRIFSGVTPSAYRPVSPDRPHHVVAAPQPRKNLFKTEVICGPTLGLKERKVQ